MTSQPQPATRRYGAGAGAEAGEPRAPLELLLGAPGAAEAPAGKPTTATPFSPSIKVFKCLCLLVFIL